MASENEIDRLVIRLIGDATQYLDMLQESVRASKEAGKSMKKAFKMVEPVAPGSAEAAAMDVANRMAADRNQILAMREAGQKRNKEQQEIDKSVGQLLNRDRKARNKAAEQEDKDIKKRADDFRQNRLNEAMEVGASVRSAQERDRRMTNRLALQADRDADRDRQKMLDDTLRRQKRHNDQIRNNQLREINERNRLREQEVNRMRELNEQTLALTVGGLGAAISGGIFAGGMFAVDEFRKFDQALTESVSIMDITKEEEKAVAKAALELGSKAVHGPAELAKAFYFMASAGLDAQQAIEALPAIQRFAVAGNFDLAAATTYASDAQASMGLKSKDAVKNMEQLVRITDVLVRADTLANATVLQFSRALTRQAGGSLKAFNKDVEEGVAVLAAMADQGVKAQLAGTHLSMVLRHLNKNAITNEAAFKRHGIAVFDAQGKMRNFADIIQDFERAFGPMSDKVKSQTMLQLGFEARMQQSILPLIGTSKAIRRYEEELRKAGGTTERVAGRQIESFNSQIKILFNLLSAVAIEIGAELAPALLAVGEAAKFGLNFWKDMDPAIKSATIAVMAGVGAFTALASAIFIAGLAFNKMFGGVGLLLGLFVTGSAAAAGAFAGLGLSIGNQSGAFNGMSKWLSGIWQWLEPVRKAFGSLTTTIINIGAALGGQAGTAFSVLVGMFESLFGVSINMETIMYDIAVAILAVEFGLLNIGKVWDIIVVAVALGSQTMMQNIIHFFNKVLPSVFRGVANGIYSMVTRLVNSIIDAFKVMGENIVIIFNKLPDILSGKVKINDILKPVNMKPLFSADDWKDIIIPSREISAVENELSGILKDMLGELGTDFDAFINQKIAELFGGKPLKKNKDKVKDAGEDIIKPMTDGINSELRRFDAALAGSAEALTRIAEFRDRMLGITGGGTGKSKDDKGRSQIEPAQNLPAVLPGLQPRVGSRAALEGGGEMGDKMIVNFLARIANATEFQAKKKPADIAVSDLNV